MAANCSPRAPRAQARVFTPSGAWEPRLQTAPQGPRAQAKLEAKSPVWHWLWAYSGLSSGLSSGPTAKPDPTGAWATTHEDATEEPSFQCAATSFKDKVTPCRRVRG